jgi:hypothetical protein
MTMTSAGLLTVCITEQCTEKVIAQASEHFDVVRASTLNSLELVLKHSQSSHILIEGLLDTLYVLRMPTREASRALGRAKVRLERLAESGVDVVVLCKTPRRDLGTRSHFLPSLCVAADRVVTEVLAA